MQVVHVLSVRLAKLSLMELLSLLHQLIVYEKHEQTQACCLSIYAGALVKRLQTK